MKKRLFSAIFALVLCCAMVPGIAWGDGDDAQSGLVISADNAAVQIPDESFAVQDFERFQKGSQKTEGTTYYGYAYYLGSTAGNVSLVATQNDVIVYVPQESATSLNFNTTDEKACDALQKALSALDEANASGGPVVTDSMKWHFTTQQEFTLNGVKYNFDQEVTSGKFYTCIIGADGSDITDPNNQVYTLITHADVAVMVAAADVALVAQPGPIEQMTTFLSHIDYSPLWVTLKTTGTAIVFIFILGLAAAYFTLRISPRAQDIFDSIFTIPMVLPPTVCGFLLLWVFGKNTALGQWFIDIGFPLVLSWPATVLAAVVVAFPLMYRSARGALENLDPNMMDAARTLGWSNAKIFFKIMLPLSWSSITAGTVLSFARALGEFGATLFLAGNYAGVTQTIPIAIYFEWMNGNIEVTWFWIIVILIFSFIVILFINLWNRRTTKYRRGAAE